MTHRQEQELKEEFHPIVVKETLKLSQQNFNLPEDDDQDKPASAKSVKSPKQESPKQTNPKAEEEDYEKDFDYYVE
jgi:hypothetical protein